MGTLRFVVRYFEELVAGTFMVLMTGATVLNVFTRYFFNDPLEWAEEFGRYTFIWVVLMGAVVATKQKKHIVIDIVLISVPASFRRVMVVIVDVLTVALMLVLAYYGWVLMTFTTQPTSTLKIPQYLIYLSVPLAAVLIIVHTIGDLRRDLAVAFSGGSR